MRRNPESRQEASGLATMEVANEPTFQISERRELDRYYSCYNGFDGGST